MADDPSVQTPAAGSGFGQGVAKALLSGKSEEDMDTGPLPERIAAALLRALKAKTPERWDMGAKKYISSDDFKTQAQTAFGIIAELEGDRAKRLPQKPKGPDETETQAAQEAVTADQLAKSPALRRALRRKLEDAEIRAANGSETGLD